MVRALQWHRKTVGSIPTGEPLVDEFFSTVPGLILDMCMIPTRVLETFTLQNLSQGEMPQTQLMRF